MNMFSGAVGGVPMCRGAGGMAAHIAFGARTGGCVVILGALLLVPALFSSNSAEALFQRLPAALLGVVLFLTGVQLAVGSSVLPAGRGDHIVVLVYAALCMWNVAAGFVVGVALHHINPARSYATLRPVRPHGTGGAPGPTSNRFRLPFAPGQ